MQKLILTDKQVQQILWAIDLTENTLEDLTDQELAGMMIDIDRKVLFEIASYLEAKIAKVGV
jgi:hypothetical protein